MKELNTYATSAFIATTEDVAYEYLCSLPNLGEWTLYSRMKEQMDEDTWMGTASGYHRPLYYHLKRLAHPTLRGIEWHCGPEYQNYIQVYPVILFPSAYVRPGSDEQGVYMHWISFCDPKRRSALLMEGIHTVHTSECRSLKGNLERKAGHRQAVEGEFRIEADTVYINAPLETGLDYLSDLRNMDNWAHLLRADGEVGRDRGNFRDEYDNQVEMEQRLEKVNEWYLLEYSAYYPEHDYYQRSVTAIIPAAHAFSDENAPGFIHHRVTFWPTSGYMPHGKLTIEDYGSESLNLKRLIEALAGNISTLEQGLSYMPQGVAAEASLT